jgi:hypothetical protein
MFGSLKRIAERWANWLGDRDLELAIRRQLNDEGYFGDSARLSNLRLVAAQRPGWLQVLTFSVEARLAIDGSDFAPLSGIARQDERYNRVEVRVFQSRSERNQLFEAWSQDLVRVRRI